MTRGPNGLIQVAGATYKECDYCGLEFESFYGGRNFCGNCERWRKNEYLRERHRTMRHMGCGVKGMKCEYCGRTFFHAGTGRPKYCAPCRPVVIRERALEIYHEKKGKDDDDKV